VSIIYIGAGVSTIFGVLTLLDGGYPGRDIYIYEKGKSIDKRQPDEVLFGAGGAGTYSDGKFVFNLELGGQLSKYTGEVKALELFDKVQTQLVRFHPDSSKIYVSTPEEVPQEVKDAGLAMRLSLTWHVGTDYLKTWVENVFKYFKEQGVSVFYDREVTNIILYDDADFNEIDFANQTSNNFINKTSSIVVAVGKGGMDLVQKLISDYNLETVPKAAQIGLRFESESKYFNKLTEDSYDLKLYKKYNDNLSIRTFCTNKVNSYVAVEDYGDIKTVNGHSFRNEYQNDLINFGIMLEIKGICNPLEYSRKFAKDFNWNNQITYFLGDFPIIPTIEGKEIKLKDLQSNFPYWNEVEDFLIKLNRLFHFEWDYTLYLPEVKFLTNEVVVDYSNLKVPGYNLYLNGDSLSARGIVVSASQGIYTAESLLREYQK